jgi:hypothetical protein
LLGTITTALAVSSAACSSGIHVSTTTAPDASLAGLRTFRVLNAPQRRADAPALSQSDPMLDNSITNRELRSDLTQGLEAKGYALDTDNPDFVVAYYAGTKEKMDTTYWNPDPYWRYGYRGLGYRGFGYRGWAWPWYGFAAPYPAMQLQEYTQGTVIVDVVDPRTKELLWRGQGVAAVSDSPSTYSKELDRTVTAILKKFPHAPASTATN